MITFKDAKEVTSDFIIIENDSFNKYVFKGAKKDGSPIFGSAKVAVHKDIFKYVNAISDSGNFTFGSSTVNTTLNAIFAINSMIKRIRVRGPREGTMHCIRNQRINRQIIRSNRSNVCK